jgi:hypothetical protein
MTIPTTHTGRFPGFENPDRNWSKLPHALVTALPIIETLSELKVILYVLRHTWGYQEYGTAKRITLDEFEHGRKRRDGSRMDGGTGLSSNAVRSGVMRAVAHGFLIQETETHRDKGRQSHVYYLRMSHPDPRVSDFAPLDVNDDSPDVQRLTSTVSRFHTRSEKDTADRDSGNRQEEKAATSVTCSIHNVPMQLRTKNGDQWYSHRLPDGTWCKGRPGDAPDNGSKKEGKTIVCHCGCKVDVRDTCIHGCYHCCDECFDKDDDLSTVR